MGSHCPPRSYDHTFHPQEAYFVGHPRADLRTAIEIFRPWPHYDAQKPSSAIDTVDIVLDESYEVLTSATLELRDAPECGTLVTPLSMSTRRKKADFAKIRQQVIQAVRESARTLFAKC